MPDAAQGWLVCGNDGWHPADLSLRSVERRCNGVMHAPMNRIGDNFGVDLKSPSEVFAKWRFFDNQIC